MSCAVRPTCLFGLLLALAFAALVANESVAQQRNYAAGRRSLISREPELAPPPYGSRPVDGRSTIPAEPRSSQWRPIGQTKVGTSMTEELPMKEAEEIPGQPVPADDPEAWQHATFENQGCGPDCGGCQQCCTDGCGGCDACCSRIHCWKYLLPRDLALSGGVHGFKGPVDRGANGNFGFNTGINLGGMIAPQCGIGYQVGAQVLQSNFSGDQTLVPTVDERSQLFLTTGLYTKATCEWGWQGGVVFDYLRDDYYVNMSLTQLRGELSFLGPRGNELGVWFAAGTRSDSVTINRVTEVWESTDIFAMFYRCSFDGGASCRAWGGATNRADGILGGDLMLPLSDCFALQSNFNYLIPHGDNVANATEEAWSLGINLVWYAGHKARCDGVARPMFSIADNATFMVDRFTR